MDGRGWKRGKGWTQRRRARSAVSTLRTSTSRSSSPGSRWRRRFPTLTVGPMRAASTRPNSHRRTRATGGRVRGRGPPLSRTQEATEVDDVEGPQIGILNETALDVEELEARMEKSGLVPHNACLVHDNR